MARLKKRSDGRYQAKIIIGYDEKGKAIHKVVYAKTQTELNEKKRTTQEKASRTKFIDADTYLTSTWIMDWLNNVKKPTLRQNTWESYESIARIHIIPGLGNVAIGKLQTPAIRAFYEEKRADGYSDRTIKYIHTVLSAALSQAVIDDVLTRNPCTGATSGTKKVKRKKEITVLTQKEVNDLLAECSGWHYTIFLLAWGSGFRREELLGARWKDIDFKKGTISVNITVIVTKDGPLLSEPKNETSYRTIPIPKEIVKALQAHKAEQNEIRLNKGLNYIDKDLVFANDDGKQRDPRRLSQIFKEKIRKAKLSDKFRLHDLRHTHATQLLQNGVHPKVVQYRLGHSTFQQTMDLYSHVIPQMQDGIAGIMSDLLNGKDDQQQQIVGRKIVNLKTKVVKQ